MEKKLDGKSVAILVADGFEQDEFTRPKAALEAAGASTLVVSLTGGTVKGWKHTDWGDSFPVDLSIHDALPDMFDALLLPGGVMSPDKLRQDEAVVAFVRHFVESGKPIAAICHGPWTLIEAGGVAGRRVTSYRSIKTDLINAGAEWIDAEVVVDNGLVTSRQPSDIPCFNQKMIEEIEEGAHGRRHTSSEREGRDMERRGM